MQFPQGHIRSRSLSRAIFRSLLLNGLAFQNAVPCSLPFCSCENPFCRRRELLAFANSIWDGKYLEIWCHTLETEDACHGTVTSAPPAAMQRLLLQLLLCNKLEILQWFANGKPHQNCKTSALAFFFLKYQASPLPYLPSLWGRDMVCLALTVAPAGL